MKIVQVISYSGYKGDETPRILRTGEREVRIREVEDRWYSPGESYFRIVTESGERYVLRHIEGQAVWTIEGYRRGALTGG